MPLWTIDGEELTVCPKKAITPESFELLNWYAHYKNNLLPVNGGVLDQSAYYLDAMKHIDDTITRIRNAK